MLAFSSISFSSGKSLRSNLNSLMRPAASLQCSGVDRVLTKNILNLSSSSQSCLAAGYLLVVASFSRMIKQSNSR
jgi:hypothetical protein